MLYIPQRTVFAHCEHLILLSFALCTFTSISFVMIVIGSWQSDSMISLSKVHKLREPCKQCTSLQVAIEADDNIVSPGPSKGKADKGKKPAKKPPGKVEVVEVGTILSISIS